MGWRVVVSGRWCGAYPSAEGTGLSMPQTVEASETRRPIRLAPAHATGNGAPGREPWQWPRPIEIAAALDGYFDGSIRKCRCPAHDDPDHDLSVAERDRRPMLYCESGCGPREIAAALHARGLWADADRAASGHGLPEPAPIRSCETREYARKLWRVCQPAIGTLGEAYLRELGVELRLPVTFRFATRLEHWPSGGSYPALVCATHDADGRFSGVQQIFLEGAAPAPVSPARMFLGEPGMIRLAALDNGTLTLASDVETALLLRGADSTSPVWAAVGASNLRRLGLPPRIRQVNLGLGQSQVDRRAAVALTQRLLKEGRDVRWFEPPRPEAARG